MIAAPKTECQLTDIYFIVADAAIICQHLYCIALSVSRQEFCVLCLPLANRNAHPETVDAARDYAQNPPFNPQTEQAERRTGKL